MPSCACYLIRRKLLAVFFKRVFYPNLKDVTLAPVRSKTNASAYVPLCRDSKDHLDTWGAASMDLNIRIATCRVHN